LDVFSPKDWHDFFMLSGGASATLLGLLFVALSLNADLIFSGHAPQLKPLAEQAFRNFLSLIVISLLLLGPFTDRAYLGNWFFAAAQVMTAFSVYRLIMGWRLAKTRKERLLVLRRVLPALLAYFSITIGAVTMIGIFDFGMSPMGFFAIGAIALLTSATTIAWDLLASVAEARHKKRL
jgi:hypothetical protein